ncbi:MAG: cupin domain-containing protein [Alphaproteobacteria bacterium]|nr:MAG: cupin domain-containing protein [Alphaproteobacteria bacterium]
MPQSPRIARSNQIAWATTEGPGHYSIKRRHLTANADPCNLGCSRYRLEPGHRPCPAHYHYGNDEAIYVLSGELTLMVDGEPHTLTDGDYVTLPRGTAVAHQLANLSDAPVDYLCFSTMEPVDVVVYPGTGKVGVFGGMAPGGQATDTSIRKFLPGTFVEYWDGETGEA